MAPNTGVIPHSPFPPMLFAIGDEPLGVNVTPYHKPSVTSRWSSCSESAVAAGQSLRRRFRCKEKPRETTMVKFLYFTHLVL
ncbi:hypothetical protein Bca4012_033295 [Brassica carinata]